MCTSVNIPHLTVTFTSTCHVLSKVHSTFLRCHVCDPFNAKQILPEFSVDVFTVSRMKLLAIMHKSSVPSTQQRHSNTKNSRLIQ